MTSGSVPEQFRAKESFETRVNAAELARSRPVDVSCANGDELKFRDPKTGMPSLIASFTKGLNHDIETGQVADPADFQAFVRAADSGDIETIAALPLGPPLDACGDPIWQSELAKSLNGGAGAVVRGWESMGAGLTFDLQGPDAQAIAVPPAPALQSPELIAEMAELYLMALARDCPFPAPFTTSKECDELFKFAIEQLNGLEWFNTPAMVGDPPAEVTRRRGEVTIDNLFRGITAGSLNGPYLSQFLIAGSAQLGDVNAGDLLNGLIRYGSQTVDQRVRIAEPGKDFLTDFSVFLDVQNAADLRGLEKYIAGSRLITTQRDLATWVHFDATFQAYFNALLILIANDVPFDPSLPFQLADSIDRQEGFTTFGVAHIYTLVTEVATRALKGIWYQKFNIHRRARPEAIGGLINVNLLSRKKGGKRIFPEVDDLVDALLPILAKIEKLNFENNLRAGDKYPEPSYLLPMAFSEGSPMHPSYGSGHAVIAGACVTVLKAFFDGDYVIPDVFEVDPTTDTLKKIEFDGTLTVNGELDKLAENVAIGRNMSGVHYFTDAWESILQGEQIAIGMLEEQKLTFRENFAFNLTKFDGTSIRI